MSNTSLKDSHKSTAKSQPTIYVLPVRTIQNVIEENQNSTGLSKVSYWNGLYAIMFLACIILFSSPAILFPMHNAIEFPKYWYELLLATIIGPSTASNLQRTFECKEFFKLNSKMTLRFFISTCVFGVLSWSVIGVATHFLWILCSGKSKIMPFGCNFGAFLGVILQLLVFRYQIPYELRVLSETQKRINTYILYDLWSAFVVQGLYALNIVIFLAFPSDLQWIWSFSFPILRWFSCWVQGKILQRSVDFQDEFPNVLINLRSNIGHSVVLAIFLGTKATEATSYLILAIDFALNLISCLQIIRMHRRVNLDTSRNLQKDNDKKQEFLGLALAKTMEIVVPLSYILTFCVAYYGPNAELLGNVRNNKWQFEAINEPVQLIATVLQMFGIDLLSGVVAGVLLWKLCGMNIIQEACRGMKVYRWYIATSLGYSFSAVCFTYIL
jgi:hypothetical protein